MSDIGFGLWMAVAGMGVVFGILALLMAVLTLLGRLDRSPATPSPGLAPPGEPPPARIVVEDEGIDEETLAAVSIAVLEHAAYRRAQAAPEMRQHEPGSHVWASRWVAAGRGAQTRPWSKR